MEALQNFFAMGGYAAFVWSSYGLACVVLVLNAVLPRSQEKTLLKQIAARRALPGEDA
ncbi:MAG: heme exporter protein CcmD [Gammaproteobacteria bacterium]|nr:heme exporter protein CcmD [Gammaproteobacteria bacterium]MBI5615214.1 heme exporter protein CcmD [Gammaproteobacteria bacterium]